MDVPPYVVLLVVSVLRERMTPRRRGRGYFDRLGPSRTPPTPTLPSPAPARGAGPGRVGAGAARSAPACRPCRLGRRPGRAGRGRGRRPTGGVPPQPANHCVLLNQPPPLPAGNPPPRAPLLRHPASGSQTGGPGGTAGRDAGKKKQIKPTLRGPSAVHRPRCGPPVNGWSTG